VLLGGGGGSIITGGKIDGGHVLIVYEAEDLSEYPAEQALIFQSVEFREWLDEKTSEDADGHENSRIWDQDTETQYIDDVWKDALAEPRDDLPWLVISDGSKGVFRGPLPESIDETKDLISRYIK
jgi:hypothetical protein